MATAQEELKSCEQELRQLEKAVEDSSNPDRLRLLPGKNPTHSDLTAKMDKVEVWLTGFQVRNLNILLVALGSAGRERAAAAREGAALRASG